MKKYKPYLKRVDLVKNQVERERIQEQEAAKKRKQRIQEQNRQRHLRYQEQLRSELAARYFHAVQSTGGDDGTASFTNTYSVLLDGTDDYINCGNVDMNSVTEQSFSVWFNSSVGTGFLFSQWGVSGQQQFLVVIGSNCDIYIDGIIRFRSTISVPLNSWNHFVITYNASNSPATTRVKAYLNNTALTNIGFNGPTSFGSGVTSDFVIGARTGYGFSEWEGYVDEFSIWSGELTTTNISDIYNSGTPNDISSLGISGLVNWWRMGDNDGGTGTTVTDQGSRGNNGTLVNAPTFETDVPS